MPEKKPKKKPDLKPMDLVATTAHELKSPLVFINGLASMLKGGQFGKLSRRQSKYISRIDDASERLLGIVENLLTINRNQHGKLNIDPEPIAPTKVIQQVISELQPRIRKQELAVVWASQLRTPPVLADGQLLYQIFYNLLDNAIKYSPKNTTITIDFKQDRHHLKILVRDRGFGIRPNDLDKLFNRFGKVSQPFDGQPSSSGLGLYIVKSMVELLGGEVSAKRLPDGSVFTVKLPTVQQLGLFDDSH